MRVSQLLAVITLATVGVVPPASAQSAGQGPTSEPSAAGSRGGSEGSGGGMMRGMPGMMQGAPGAGMPMMHGRSQGQEGDAAAAGSAPMPMMRMMHHPPQVMIVINTNDMPMMMHHGMGMMGQRGSMHGAGTMAASGDPDIDFARAMIEHHEDALRMARSVLEQGKDPEIRKLAEQVISSQEQEIASLRSWLEQHPPR